MHVRCRRSKYPISNVEPLVEHRNPAGVPTQLPCYEYDQVKEKKCKPERYEDSKYRK
jgi:hypothetical protein